MSRLHSNDQQDQKERKQLNEVDIRRSRFELWKIFLVETARPSSPSADQSRQEYRRTGGYDKQGEVGAGSAQPEFVILFISSDQSLFIRFSFS